MCYLRPSVGELVRELVVVSGHCALLFSAGSRCANCGTATVEQLDLNAPSNRGAVDVLEEIPYNNWDSSTIWIGRSVNQHLSNVLVTDIQAVSTLKQVVVLRLSTDSAVADQSFRHLVCRGRGAMISGAGSYSE